MIEHIINDIKQDLSTIDKSLDIKINIKLPRNNKHKNAYILWQNYQNIEDNKSEQQSLALKSIKQKYDIIIQQINKLKLIYTINIGNLEIKKSIKLELQLKINHTLRQVSNEVYTNYLNTKKNILHKTKSQTWIGFLSAKTKTNPIAKKIISSTINLQYHKKRNYNLSLNYNINPSFSASLFRHSSYSYSIKPGIYA